MAVAERTVRANDGCLLHMRVMGQEDTPALLLAHPIGFDGRFWDEAATALSADYRLLIPDARGHGQSERGSGETSIAQLSDDMRALITAADCDGVTVIGCSLGSATAMRLAASGSPLLAGVVLANAPARVPLSRAQFDDGIAAARAGGYADMARGMMARWTMPGSAAARPEWYALQAARMAATDPDGFADAFAALRDSDRTEDLTRIAVPALVLTGEYDHAFPPAAAASMASQVADGYVEVVANAGHLAPLEMPEAFAAAVQSFLRERVYILADR